MENYIIEKDLPVWFVKAASFPAGMAPAFEKVHQLVPKGQSRATYGISRPEGDINSIGYKAAVTKFDNETVAGLEETIIPAGNYKSIRLENYNEDISMIGKAVEELVKIPALDPNGFCLEIYVSEKEVICAVPLK